MTSPKLSASSTVCVLAGVRCGEGGRWILGIQASMKRKRIKRFYYLCSRHAKRISRLPYKSKRTRRLFAVKRIFASCLLIFASYRNTRAYPSHIPTTAYPLPSPSPTYNINKQQYVGFPSFHRRDIFSGNSKSTGFTP